MLVYVHSFYVSCSGIIEGQLVDTLIDQYPVVGDLQNHITMHSLSAVQGLPPRRLAQTSGSRNDGDSSRYYGGFEVPFYEGKSKVSKND